MSASLPICGSCGATMPVAGSGRPRRYCSDRCRMAAYRRRIAAARAELELAEDAEPIELDPAAPAWAIVAAEPSPARRSVHPDEQTARAVLEAWRVAAAFARLGREARPSLAWRCEKLSETIRKALAELFPEAGQNGTR